MAISVTSIFCAFLRGFHWHFDDYNICDDSFALRIIPEERQRLIRNGFLGAIPDVREPLPEKEADALISAIIRTIPTTAQVLGRTRYCENELQSFLEEGNSQYIILGAGLDTYSLRRDNSLPSKIFEIDQADTQNFKKEQLLRISGGLPENTEFISADLATERLSKVMQRSSFDAEKKSFVSALGLLMYLGEDELNGLFDSLSRICAPESLVVFDYFDDTTFDERKSSNAFNKWINQGKLTGEHIKSCFSYERATSLAKAHCFEIKNHLSPDEIQDKFFSNERSAYAACEHVHFMTLRKE